MNRDDYGDIDKTFFNMGESCIVSKVDISVSALGVIFGALDVTIYDIDDNKELNISVSDIFDEEEFIDEYIDLSCIDDNYG